MYTAATLAILAGTTLALSSYAPAASAPAYETTPAAPSSSSIPSSWASQPVGYGSSSLVSSAVPSEYASSSSSAVISAYPPGSSYSSSSYVLHPTGYISSSSSPSASGPSPPASYPPGSYPPGSWPHPGQPGSNPNHPGGPVGGHPSGPGGWTPPSTPGAGCPVNPNEYCLSYEDSEEAADVFRELIQNYSDELALEYLTEDFVDYSSAVSIIINGGDGEPLDIEKPTFVGRQAFMDAQGSQPEIPFKKLQRFHGCNSVSMRWLTRRSANGQPTETARIPVVGNVIIETVQSNPGDAHNFRIKTIFSEFNSAAWLVNLGVFVPENGTEGDAGNKRSLPVDLRGPMI